MDKGKIQRHNFKIRIINAAFANDIKTVHQVADEIFNAGLELEDIGLIPGMFDAIGGVLIKSGWTPPKFETPQAQEGSEGK